MTLAASVVAVSSLTPPLASQSRPPAPVCPGTTWAKWDRPEDASYTPARLDAVRAWLRVGQTKALFAAVDGKELFTYGDVTAASKVASVRKSVLAMLYGRYVAEGTIDLSKTVVELGLTDVQPFLEVERSATLRHLLMARSGIYLPSGNEALTSVSPLRRT
jgi:CubicO group peptidase (beta-lactamase class C family)